MSQELKLFETIPYKVRKITDPYLSVEDAQHAIETILAEEVLDCDMPKLNEIMQVANNNSFGFYNLYITVYKDKPFPNYMLNAPVVNSDKVINIFFESASINMPANPVQVKNNAHNLITNICAELNLSYLDLSQATGYSAEKIDIAGSTGEISKTMQKAIELFAENQKLKHEIGLCQKIKNTLKEWLQI